MNPPIQTKDLDDPYVADDFLSRLSIANWKKSDGVSKHQLSYGDTEVVPCHNGFIWAAAKVYDSDSALTIRIDDMWLAMLAHLKPVLYRHSRFTRITTLSTFTNEDLDDRILVASRLTDVVKTKLGDPLASTLMPNFSTTMPVDTTSAALFLLGDYCEFRQHRTLSPKKNRSFKNTIFVGGPRDWISLRQKLAQIRILRKELEPLVNSLSGLVNLILQAGLQQDNSHNTGEPPYVALEQSGHLSAGWLLNFLQPLANNQPRFHLDKESHPAVATLPILVKDGQDLHHHTMIGGLLGYSTSPIVDDMQTQTERHLVQPVSGWMTYNDKAPTASTRKMAKEQQEK
ncbi:uncharacterized protein FSUBG_4750 [Fusarium subglutinans]|uniref:Uncharacterized protein n=1 Tax=Gibberella subglutinans TaxID=42677 RepID=A0A8H5Q407_GIBSU|nr:uncharacterized protein FSUBG_4750 [Fusarium subglutinans]KAF5608214.1 hypothetical protein FSUBG_4750 [Fusarium subglutinans]